MTQHDFSQEHDTSTTSTGDGRRKHGRVLPRGLLSSMGPVLDLSAGGLRALSKRPKSGTGQIILYDQPTPLTLDAEVVWSRRLGFFRHEIGLRFVNVTPHQMRKLTAIASTYRQISILAA